MIPLLRLLGGLPLGLWAVALPSLALQPPLSPADLTTALEELPAWGHTENALITTCQFTDFGETVDFAQQLVAPADALVHHPDLAITYNRLTIRLTTHDAGGITALDVTLAHTISELAAGRCQPPVAAER